MKKKKRLLTLALGCTLLCAILAGCSVAGEPRTASRVVERSMEVMSEDPNYHMDTELSMKMSLAAEELFMEFPLSMDFSADVRGENVHGITTLATSFRNGPETEQTELYTNGDTVYRCDFGTWTSTTETDHYLQMALAFTKLDPKYFETAGLLHNRETGMYTVTQNFLEFIKDEDASRVLAELYAGAANIVQIDPGTLLNGWKHASLTYEFDEDFRLRSVTLNGSDHSELLPRGEVDVNAFITLDLAFVFSEYGEISKGDVTVPEFVKAACRASAAQRERID